MKIAIWSPDLESQDHSLAAARTATQPKNTAKPKRRTCPWPFSFTRSANQNQNTAQPPAPTSIKQKLDRLSQFYNQAREGGADIFVVPEFYLADAMHNWTDSTTRHAFDENDFRAYHEKVQQLTQGAPGMLAVAGTMVYQTDDKQYYNKCLYGYNQQVHEHHKATIVEQEKQRMVAPTAETPFVRCNETMYSQLIGPNGFKYAIEICADSDSTMLPNDIDVSVVCAYGLGRKVGPIAKNRVEIVCDGVGYGRVSLPAAGEKFKQEVNVLDDSSFNIVTISDEHILALREERNKPAQEVKPSGKWVSPSVRRKMEQAAREQAAREQGSSDPGASSTST